ncbi:MAG: SBBP repeat-containing protein [Phycisphaerales bacterium]|nr:SBBP repeat-containing protein [Phycisphaerales bacterium]
MRRFTTWSAMGVVLACCVLIAPPATGGPAESDPAASEMLKLGLCGVYIVPNQGQWADREVHYALRSRGLDVAFRESALTMHLTRHVDSISRADASTSRADASTSRAAASTSRAREEAALNVERDVPLADTRGSSGESAAYDGLTLTITFPGSNGVLPIGAQPQAAKFNYFVGGEGRATASGVLSYGAVIYEDLYDGVDLHVRGNDDGVLKYEFHVAPGADYAQIRIAYHGIDSLCIDEAGNVQINTSFGTLADGAPVVYHPRSLTGGFVKGQSRDAVPARFELCDDRTYRFALDGPVDPTRELIIDPDLEWMTYLGGSGGDRGNGIAVDSAGNALVTGFTYSTDFEGRNNAYRGGEYDAFVVKVSGSGALQWMTYLGGRLDDEGYDIAVDGAGNALVAGNTYSPDFEGRNNASHGGPYDAFVVKVSASGALQWMTYLGGSRDDFGGGVAVDKAGNLLVTGSTTSTDFEGRNNAYRGYYDAFAVKVSGSGALQWMTYLGGTDYDYGRGIAVDGTGNALVTGGTGSFDFEGRNNASHGGASDAFVVKVSGSGDLQWMTYLGGSDREEGNGIAVDSAGKSLVTGETWSSVFEGRNNAYHNYADGFVVKVSASGALQWMTYLGGSAYDWGNGIAVDSTGNALVTGETHSTDFEGRNNTEHGSYDAFVVKVSPPGALQWMTYLGGRNNDYGEGIAVDSAGNALTTGGTASTAFEGRNNAYHGGTMDAFVVKLRGAGSGGLQLLVAATCPSGGPIQISWSGATGGGQIALIFARDTGSFIIPNNHPCAGTTLGLGSNEIQIAYQGSAGQNGSRTLNSTTGPGPCGGYLQLVDIATCGTSNVARIE